MKESRRRRDPAAAFVKENYRAGMPVSTIFAQSETP
jgi:hypothetical protein